ncbi:sensor histidine kinase, partial [Candidatus Arthromitus sp. SFB-turkey]|uniref:sensor histidine kinase n=1 Tax=Candidatus Arthromitus sp. SFB-turkey TaxID=1840217 RepID=UPI001FA7071E
SEGMIFMRKNKSTVYKRIFIMNTIMVVFLIVSLDIYFVKNIVRNVKEMQFYINEKVVNDVNEELNKIYDHSNNLVNDIYIDELIIRDIIDFLNMDTITYLKYKIDKLSNSDNYYYKGIENFTKLSFLENDNLKEITFVSFNRNEQSTFNRLNQIAVKKIDQHKFYTNGELLKSISDKDTISFIREINNPVDLKKEGLILLTYDLRYLNYIYEEYDRKTNIIVLDNNGYVIYDSKEMLNYEPYIFYEKVINSEKNKKLMLDDSYYVENILSDGNIRAISIIKAQELEDLPNAILIFIFIGLILFILSQGVSYFKLKVLGDRTNNILNAMDKVKNGNLDVEISLTSDSDEINYIAENFNYMCKDLNKYIDKIYKAELEQKKCEMLALQSQINPHFLYNTLESIRMKAICNGDKEVGKMLYTLSFLFRKQLKEKNIISIENELDYCRKYIEIFKFRYYDSFQFFIECDEEVKQMQIIKFALQPLVENYFIHGIRLEDEDNILKIIVSKEDNDIIIKIIDNGKGIDDVKLCLLNENIKNRKYEGDSIGIINVHERIILEYGKAYGVRLFKTKDKENIVMVKIPCKGV